MIIYLQSVVDLMFARNPNDAVLIFKALGTPIVKETTTGIKYYVYE